jgi:ATP-dependent DNA helicase RecG
MAITMEEFDRILQAPSENELLEFKEAKQKFDFGKLCGYCVAIANEGNGKLILGVTDKPPRQVVGTNAHKDLEKVKHDVYEALRISVQIDELNRSDGRVLVFHIPSRPRGVPYHYEGKYLMRSGASLVPMTEDRLRAIFAEGNLEWTQQFAREGCTTAEIKQLLVTERYFTLLDLPEPTGDDAVIERFEKEKLIVNQANGWAVTNLGAILFAKRLDDFDGLQRKSPRIVVYKGKGKLETQSDTPTSEGYAVGFEEWMRKIMSSLTSEVIEGAFRKERKIFPEIAIRELMANALIHQDFTETGASVMFEMYSDRMEISNPGKPLIETERFIDEYRSRNERLADLMRRLRMCEEKGSGVDKVIKEMEIKQLPAPDFQADSVRTKVILYARRNFDDLDRSERIRACYQHCCLQYAMNEKMSNQSLRERFGLPESKAALVSQAINATLDAGKIKLVDNQTKSKKYARYIPFWA